MCGNNYDFYMSLEECFDSELDILGMLTQRYMQARAY